MLMPDHSPGHPDDAPHPDGSGRVRQGWAFQFGYIKALIQAVTKELGDGKLKLAEMKSKI